MSAFVNIIIKSGLGRIPVPVFGSVATLTTWARYSSRSMVPAIPWAFPLVVGGLWFIWPAVDEEFKIDMGFMKNPNPAPAPVEEVKLDAVAKKAVENAYKPHEEERRPSEKEVEVEKELRKGNFTPLEKDWDDFLAKVSNFIFHALCIAAKLR
jgi:hypothetical protein